MQIIRALMYHFPIFISTFKKNSCSFGITKLLVFFSILAPEFLCAVGNSIPRHCLHLWCLRIWRIPIRIIYSLCFHQHSFDFSRPNNLFSTLKAKVGFFYYHHFQQIHSYFILYISHLIVSYYLHTIHIIKLATHCDLITNFRLVGNCTRKIITTYYLLHCLKWTQNEWRIHVHCPNIRLFAY